MSFREIMARLGGATFLIVIGYVLLRLVSPALEDGGWAEATFGWFTVAAGSYVAFGLFYAAIRVAMSIVPSTATATATTSPSWWERVEWRQIALHLTAAPVAGWVTVLADWGDWPAGFIFGSLVGLTALLLFYPQQSLLGEVKTAASGLFGFLTATGSWILFHVFGIDVKRFEKQKPGVFLWVAIGGVAALVIFSMIADFIGASPADVTRFSWRLVRQVSRFVVNVFGGTPALPPHPDPGLAFRAIFPATSAIIVWYLVTARRPKYLISVGVMGYLLYLWMSPTPTGQRLGTLARNFSNIGQAKLDGLNYETAAWARIAEIQADGKRTGRLVRTKVATACLDDRGVEILSTTGDRSLLRKGREGRIDLERVPTGQLIAALDRQEPVRVSFQYEEEDPQWSRGVLHCWVDSGYLEPAGVRPLLTSGQEVTKPQTAPPAAPSAQAPQAAQSALSPENNEQVLTLKKGERSEWFTYPTCFRWNGDLFYFVVKATGKRIPVGPSGVDLVNKRDDYCYEGGPGGNTIRIRKEGARGCPIA